MKNSFVLYTSYMEQLELLTMEQRGILLTAIMMYMSGADPPQMDAATTMAFAFIKTDLDENREKYEATCEARREAGKKGGRSKANGLQKKQMVFLPSKANQKNPDYEYEYDDDLKEKPTYVGQKKFKPPTSEEVRQYAIEKGYSMDAEKFCDYYSSNGWKVGKNSMKDWKAAVRNWNRNQRQGITTETTRIKKPTTQRDIDFQALELALFERDLKGQDYEKHTHQNDLHREGLGNL